MFIDSDSSVRELQFTADGRVHEFGDANGGLIELTNLYPDFENKMSYGEEPSYIPIDEVPDYEGLSPEPTIESYGFEINNGTSDDPLDHELKWFAVRADHLARYEDQLVLHDLQTTNETATFRARTYWSKHSKQWRVRGAERDYRGRQWQRHAA